MSRPVVLLVEDDPSVARFVSMALEILPVAVETCPCVESALAWLRHHRAALVITDLMLPGESGMALLRQLQAEPAPGGRGAHRGAQRRPGPCRAAGTGRLRRVARAGQAGRRGGTGTVRSGSAGRCAGVFRRGRRRGHRGRAALAGRGRQRGGDRGVNGHPGVFQRRRRAVPRLSRRLPRAVRPRCRRGDRALRSRDLAALRRLCHSLSSVLRTLGRTEDGALAREAELAARDGRHEAARDLWLALSRRLDR